MKQKKIKFSLNNTIFLMSLFAVSIANAQQVSIEFSSSRIALNEPFNISVESQDKEIEKISSFPEIEGFKKLKSGLVNATSTSTIKGKVTITYIVTQTYHPLREGTFQLKAFDIEVNNKKISSEGLLITVGEYDKNKGDLVEFDPTELFLLEEEKKLIDVKEDAFLGLVVDKNEVFVGESFHVSLSLYVAANNTAPMKYYDLGIQVEEITKKLKPVNCWEENFDIREIPEPPLVEIAGKKYYQNKFYEAIFFPINTEPITLPQVGLKMLVKKKIDTSNPNQFDEQKDLEIKTFISNSRRIIVKPLPSHPLKDKIAVGKFYLKENYPYQVLKTGEPFRYLFQIAGEGNIAAIHHPILKPIIGLEFYAPNNQQYIIKGQGKINGAMTYDYQVVSKEAGEYELKHQFEWIFFNLNTLQYDTLKPVARIKVSGESIRDAEISSLEINPFYKRIQYESNQLSPKPSFSQFRSLIGFFIFSLLVAMLLFFIRS